MHEGEVSSMLGLKGIPAEAEEIPLARDIALARMTGARLHLLHVSTAGSVELVRRAKAAGLRVTAEATPHHATLTDAELAAYDTNCKVNPPLRTGADAEAIRRALSRGKPFGHLRFETLGGAVVGASENTLRRLRTLKPAPRPELAGAFAAAGDEDILAQAGALAEDMLGRGTTCFECKTGYGLSVEQEARAARLAAALGSAVPQPTTVTGLLAHAVPEGFTADAWMDEVETLAEQVECTALDIYVESVAFSNEHLTRMGAIAARTGRALRAHVEQFNANRSVPVALDAGARSVDHLARLHPDDLPPLAAAECAAVLLPGAEFLGAEAVAPARALADAGAICVLGTDCNPGTSPIASMPLVIGLAVRRYGWSVKEALLATTLNPAWVLGLSGALGSLEAGKRADLILLDGPVAHLPYRFGRNPVAAAFVAGEPVHVRPDQAWRLRG
jgi:imidazolonepropionase